MKTKPKFTATDCPGVTKDEQRKTFLKYFIGNEVPSGLFNSDDLNVLYLCQTGSPNGQGESYYSTIFDTTTKNPILSAYFVTAEQALRLTKKKGKAKRPTGNQWESDHSKLLN